LYCNRRKPNDLVLLLLENYQSIVNLYKDGMVMENEKGIPDGGYNRNRRRSPEKKEVK